MENSGRVTRIAATVDASLATVKLALKAKADLMIVHHGLFWGQTEPVIGHFARKIELALTSGLSLYAAHLPLDGHADYGNAAQLAKNVLGANEINSAFEQNGTPIGVVARLSSPVDVDDLVLLLSRCEGALNPPLALKFGRKKIQTIGIVTGSATSLISTASKNNLDLFITGEPKHEAYHLAKELELSVICMGHYASETFGVRALQRVLEEQFSVQTAWISEPTGI